MTAAKKATPQSKYPKCYELINLNYGLPIPGGYVRLRAGFNNLYDESQQKAVYEHPTTQMLLSCGKIISYDFHKNTGVVNSLGLEVADGGLADNLPIAELDPKEGNTSKYKLGSDEEVGKAKATVEKNVKAGSKFQAVKTDA